MNKSQIYKQAKYYELAFSFVEPKKQADLFEEFIEKYSEIEVNSILELACGTALQIRELAKRNYKTIALDSSSEMLDFLKNEALKKNLPIETVRANMNNFELKEEVEFAYIMMGSIVYTQNNNKSFLSHLDSIAKIMKSGGLYLIENFSSLNWTDDSFFKPESWTMEEDGIKVKTTYQITPKDPIKQTILQKIELDVDDNGKREKFIDEDELKMIFPEELKLLIQINTKFELLGFFERNSINPLEKASANNIVLLRKK